MVGESGVRDNLPMRAIPILLPCGQESDPLEGGRLGWGVKNLSPFPKSRIKEDFPSGRKNGFGRPQPAPNGPKTPSRKPKSAQNRPITSPRFTLKWTDLARNGPKNKNLGWWQGLSVLAGCHSERSEESKVPAGSQRCCNKNLRFLPLAGMTAGAIVARRSQNRKLLCGGRAFSFSFAR